MAEKKNIPAFPSRSRFDSANDSFDLNSEGMTLRDYFAIHANEEDIKSFISKEERIGRAEARFMSADAMMEAREK